MIAADFDTESYRLFGTGFYNPKPAMQWYWDQYVPAADDRESSVRFAAAGGTWRDCHPQLSSSPATIHFVTRASLTPTLSTPAGVTTARYLFEGGIHGFMTMPMLDIAQEARQQACRELSRLLG